MLLLLPLTLLAIATKNPLFMVMHVIEFILMIINAIYIIYKIIANKKISLK